MERADAAVDAESRKRKREEYEMQLFGFHSRAVYATLRNIITSRIQSKTRKLGEALESCNTDPESLDAIKINEAQLVKAYQAASLPHLKTIENIVNKFVCVPGNVLADEDKLQRTRCTEAELENVRKKLDELQQRAKRATILNAALKEELQLIEQFSNCADNADKLSQMMESNVAHRDVSEKIHRLIKNYKQFNASLDDAALVSQRVLYNAMDDFERVDCNIDNL